MSDKAINLQDDAVVSLNSGRDQLLIQHRTFRIDELMGQLESTLGSNRRWFGEGIDCEVLHPGGLWIEGKVRIRIEFCPIGSEFMDATITNDNSDSELDDIRQILSQDK